MNLSRKIKTFIKNNTYTIYSGKEHRLLKRGGYAGLISSSPLDLDNGFTEKDSEKHLIPRTFFKMVPPPEIEEVYEISTCALYQGYEFRIKWASENEYLLNGNNNLTLMNKLDFKRVGKYGCEKLVKKDEVDLVYEGGELITDFFD